MVQESKMTISLPPRLVEPLRREAEEQGTEIEELVSALVAQHIREREPDTLRDEAPAFRIMHEELLAHYRGRYVAIHKGQVVDDDANRRDLYLRIRSRFGDTPVLIRQVSEVAEREIVVHSPRFERGD